MKVAITGAAGLFGHGLVAAFAARHTVLPLTHKDVDLTDRDAVREALFRLKPELVVHPAGIPDLDACEAHPARAFLVNVHGTRHIVEIASEVGAEVAYVSTDAVFDGKKQTSYTEADPPHPFTVYGRTKLRAERIVQSRPNHWVFRVSVLFGPGKTNFIEKGLHKLAAGEPYVVAADQMGSATYTIDAGHKMAEVIEARCYGLYHLSNLGPCTRLELARQAAECAGLDPNLVVGKPADQMGRRAPRLKYAVMEMAALKQAGFALPRPWQEALAEYVRALPH
jgi:dTDP-4-dehydrorhamnose reductase